MGTVADAMRPVVEATLGRSLPVRIRCWDGSELGPPGANSALLIDSPRALRRLLWAPNELGLGRAYVSGEIDVDGDIFDVLALRDAIGEPGEHIELDLGFRGWAAVARAAAALGALGLPPSPPAEEARLRGRLHGKRRDAGAIAHHYDVSNDFYRLILGPTMTYSCAYFASEDMSLEDAQTNKHRWIGLKLGLEPGMRLLDVGCGWGGMAVHAARLGVEVVGITISEEQARFAAERAAAEGLADRIEIRKQDYRDVSDGPFDVISSIGMFEHVGAARLAEYFVKLRGLLKDEGRLLNHGIARPPGRSGFGKRSFIARYVFPDGELHSIGDVMKAMEQAGFEVRDVESLREHYAITLRAWVRNLEANWREAQRLAGPARARSWRLYMAGSALNFEAGRNSVYQVLGIRPGPSGAGGLPLTREAILGRGADARFG